MKKIYLLLGATLLSVVSFAQTVRTIGPLKPVAFHSSILGGERVNLDTTGIGINGMVDFLPVFAPTGSVYTSAYTAGGYIYGVAPSSQAGVKFDKCAQGYLNLSNLPIKVEGVLLFFVAKESDLTTSATSKVVVKAWAMAPNKALATVTAGTLNQTVYNAPGPATSVNAPQASADLLFADVDTLNYNYVTFPTPVAFSTDFAIGLDCVNLAAGDTVGLAMDAPGDDGGTIHYSFLNVVSKWFVTGQLVGTASAEINNEIGLWAVYTNATGVSEYFNGMKLTTYPNPVVDKATIEYTLEKNSANVKLVVLDATGKKVIDNSYSNQTAGIYKVDVATDKLAAGSYFYQLTSNGYSFAKKFVVTK